MAKKKKEETTSKPEVKQVFKEKAKPEKPDFYNDDEVQMPSVMLKDKDSFIKIWKGNLKRMDVNEAWQRAEKWLSKYE